MKESTIWNGHAIYGDCGELDKVIAGEGPITISKEDILGVLTHPGKHLIVIGEGPDTKSALNAAISSLSISLGKVTAMVIHISCNSLSTYQMNEVSEIMNSLVALLSADCELLWSIAEDSRINQSRKIILLVSAGE